MAAARRRPAARPSPASCSSTRQRATVGNLQRRMFTGPWQWNWDMSIKKSFKIKERHSLDVGADLINWMNHPTF